jgi:Tfp pilus assembly protein FimT
MISNSLSNIGLKTSARKLASILRYTRNQAISYKNNYTLFIDAENNRVVVKRFYKDRTEIKHIFNFKKELKIRFKGNLEEITFSPLGGSSGGEIEIENNKGNSYTIHVNPLNGRVSLYFKE